MLPVNVKAHTRRCDYENGYCNILGLRLGKRKLSA